MTRIVCDAGPLLHLSEAHALDLLSLAGEVHIPKGVEAEVAHHLPAWLRPAWIAVDALSLSHAEEAAAWRRARLLDAGEAEAIALARQLGAEWFLTDDAAARVIARALGLEVHGSLGVVLWAAAVGHVDRAAAEAALARLTQSSLWLSSGVLAEARTALDQLFGG